jgi:hypothetical protein
MSGNWDRKRFCTAYVAAGGSPRSADSYASYLTRADRVLGGLSSETARRDGASLIRRAVGLPTTNWGGAREQRDSLAALRKFVELSVSIDLGVQPELSDTGPFAHAAASIDLEPDAAVVDLLAQAQRLGSAYYQLTGKPLGVTGEVAEYEAASLLGLQLCVARTPGHDAIESDTRLRIQIKGRAIDAGDRYRGMCPAIKCMADVDVVMLVLLDRTTLTALEIWRADIASVQRRSEGLSAEKRRRNAILSISQFRSIATLVYLKPAR